ncbi:MAG: cytochrome B6 [Cyanobacteria bacterium SW_5_48_44]|nr:MAG: cytochrome B6 [Cyanobacteria bacterium SW_5_48_44]
MEIGQKVKVFRLRDRFKMTDGSGVGAIVEFDDQTTTWFFEDELKPVEQQ